MRALLWGTPGRTPFAGHFRGRWAADGAELCWAGRVRASASPEEAWAAAESARDAMAAALGAGWGASSGDSLGADRFALIDAAWAALRTLDHPDITVLLVASDSDGVSVAASGLVELRVDGEPVAEAEHPLFDEPGVRERPGYFHPPCAGTEWVGVPVGGRWTKGDVLLLCGTRSAP